MLLISLIKQRDLCTHNLNLHNKKLLKIIIFLIYYLIAFKELINMRLNNIQNYIKLCLLNQ